VAALRSFGASERWCSSRLINRVTIANRRLTEIPHIRTPMTLSRGANVR
jgi:hypothetical protein